MPHVWHEHMATPNIFYGKFSEARMATFFSDGKFQFFFGVCFSFRMATLVVKNIRARLLRTTGMPLVIWEKQKEPPEEYHNEASTSKLRR